MRGRKPTPRSLRIMTGVPEAKLRTPPQPARQKLVAPRWLSESARELWDEITPELAALGVVCALDRAILTCYCETYSTWKQAVEVLRRDGLTYQAPNGLQKRHPAAAVAADALKSLRLAGDELGLAPLARQRLDSRPADGEADTLQAFLEGDCPALPPPGEPLNPETLPGA